MIRKYKVEHLCHKKGKTGSVGISRLFGVPSMERRTFRQTDGDATVPLPLGALDHAVEPAAELVRPEVLLGSQPVELHCPLAGQRRSGDLTRFGRPVGPFRAAFQSLEYFFAGGSHCRRAALEAGGYEAPRAQFLRRWKADSSEPHDDRGAV